MAERRTFRVALRAFDPFAVAIEKAWTGFRRHERTELDLGTVQLELEPLYDLLFVQEGLKRGEWDVALINTDWMPVAQESGAVLDLAPMIAARPPDDYPDGWMPSLLQFQKFGDRIIGLPYHDGPECLIFRTDLFDDPDEQAEYRRRHGHPLRPPKTWDEFHRIARFFHRPQEKLYGTVFAAYPDGHNTVYDFALQVWSRGDELLDRTGRLNLDSRAVIEGLSFYRHIMSDDAAIHPQSRQYDSVASGLAFSRGEVALMQNWFGFAAMAETIPDSRVKGRVDVAEVPHGAGGRSTSLNVYWILTVAAGSPYPELAYRFLRHCASLQADKALTLSGGIGCRRSTWQDQEVNAVIPFYHRMEGLHRNAQQLPRLSTWPRLAGIIDELVLETINTDRPISEITAEAQRRVDALPV